MANPSASPWNLRPANGWILLAIVAVSWPAWSFAPGVGLDPSWKIGLVLAHEHGLRFGDGFVYTYGPLGFVTVPAAFSLSSIIWALAYAVAGGLVLAHALTSACDRRFGHPWGLAIAGSVAVLAPLEHFQAETYSIALVLLACLATRGQAWVPPAFAVYVGVAASVQLLVKPGAGLLAGIALLIVALARRAGRVRQLALGGAGLLVGFIGVWFSAGQYLSDIPDWLRLTASISGGYTRAMMIDERGRSYDYLVLAGLLGWAIALTIRACRSASEGWIAWVRGGLVFSAYWVLLKEGLVRHDPHVTIAYFGLIFVVLALTAMHERVRILVALVASAGLFTVGASEVPVFAPASSVEGLARTVSLIVFSGDRRQVDLEARGDAKVQLAVPQSVIDRIGPATVHIDPNESSVAWAYGLNWDPVPVFQRMLTYTDRADALNARALASISAPEFVLRQDAPSIDGRNRFWDSPRYMIALICNYREALVEGQWELLAHAPSRCESPRSIGLVRAAANESVAVPHPRLRGGIVVVSVDRPESLLFDVETVVSKPFHVFTLVADGIGYRIPTPPSSGPLLVRVPGGIWATRFGGGLSYRLLQTSLPATYRFFEIDHAR